MVSKTEYNRDLRHKHQALGLCAECGSPVLEGAYHCKACQEKRKQYEHTPAYKYRRAISTRVYRTKNRELLIEQSRHYRKQYLMENRCYCCGTPLITDEVKYCVNCVNANRVSMQKQGVLKYETAD